MKIIGALSLAFLSLYLLSGCTMYTPPIEIPVDNQIVINKPFDTVWELTIDWFATTGVTLNKIEKGSGLISTAPGSIVPGEYMNCGIIDNGRYENIRSSMNVVIRKMNDKQSKVSINVNCSADAVGRNGYGSILFFQKARCYSTGVLEQSLQNHLLSAH